MIKIQFENPNCLPAIEDASEVNWQIKWMRNNTTETEIINGLKDAYRRYRVDADMNILEEQYVYESVSDALKEGYSVDRELDWVETTMEFEAEMIGDKDGYRYKYEIRGSDGILEDSKLVHKKPIK